MGIINRQSQQPAGGQQPGQGGQAEQVYKRIGLAAIKLIFSNPDSDHLLNILRRGAESPAHAVAVAAMSVISRLQREIKGIDPKLAFSVAPSVVVFLLQLGDAAGVFQASVPLIQESISALSNLAKDQGEPQGAEQTEQMGQPQPMGA